MLLCVKAWLVYLHGGKLVLLLYMAVHVDNVIMVGVCLRHMTIICLMKLGTLLRRRL